MDSKTLTELRRQAYRIYNNKSLRKAQRDLQDVKQLQLLLRQAGYYRGQVDGTMGPETVKAIKEFQKSKNLKVDGIVGTRTWEELKKFENRR